MATHRCPGCGADGIAYERLACKPCWARLPGGIRNWVGAAYRRRLQDPGSHTRALLAAMRWYKNDPATTGGAAGR